MEQRLAKTKISSGDLDGAASLFQKLLERKPPCGPQRPPTRDCENLAVLLSWTGDLYGAMGRPSLGEPEKAAVFYQQALDIEERVAAQDSHNRQAQFNLAARCGKLGDAVWRSDPKRALALYERALTTARALVSSEQFHILREAYLEASSRPLIELGRTAEARRAATELMELARTDPIPTEYADRLGELTVRTLWPRLLAAEGKLGEARRMLEALIQEAGKLRAEHTTDLGPVNLFPAVTGISPRSPPGRSAAKRCSAAPPPGIPGPPPASPGAKNRRTSRRRTNSARQLTSDAARDTLESQPSISARPARAATSPAWINCGPQSKAFQSTPRTSGVITKSFSRSTLSSGFA